VVPDGAADLPSDTARKQAAHDPKETTMKRILLLSVLGTALIAFAVPASAAPGGATLIIQHQMRGCHSWSLNGGPMKVTQHMNLARGGSLVITNNDAMFHKLIKVSGPAVAFKLVKLGTPIMHAVKLPWARGMMGRPGATLKVTFPKAGVYTFKTVFGEDWMPMPETIGEDHVLKAVVTVS
jgi:hypothetical protein